MDGTIAFIGFGEAGQAFAALRASARPRAFDVKTVCGFAKSAKWADYERCDIAGQESPAAALRDARVVLSLVTADQAAQAARLYAPLVQKSAFWLDMNSVAPATKRVAAGEIERAGGRYVDVAVMSPVNPLGLAVPLLVSGRDADAAVKVLTDIGFTSVRAVGDEIGAASAIKMIRSVMVKGLEALTAECVLAAEAAGVRNEVIGSLDASWPGTDWSAKADYSLDRMMVHGERRAAEMEEVVATLEALGTGSSMSRGTVGRQRAIGELHIAPPAGLAAKLEALKPFRDLARERAA